MQINTLPSMRQPVWTMSDGFQRQCSAQRPRRPLRFSFSAGNQTAEDAGDAEELSDRERSTHNDATDVDSLTGINVYALLLSLTQELD